MSTEFHAASAQLPDRGAPVAPAFTALRARLAAVLRERAPEIAERWETQSRTVALRQPRGDERAPANSPAAALVMALAGALEAEHGPSSDDLIALGLTFGLEAFEAGGSLHHALKGLDLLLAMVLYTAETSLGEASADTRPGPTGSVVDGIRVSRQLQQASSLLTLAAAKGFTEAMNDATRDHLRHLRHDLRNPLGTIKSVLAMMDDETMPAEERAHPRFRAMAKRNARTLGELIADRLGENETLVPTRALQLVSLRAIACGVRRDLRGLSAARSAAIVVGSARVQGLVDAIGLELLLHELLQAALQEASPGDELHVEFGEVHGARASLTVRGGAGRQPVSEAGTLERLAALARQLHGELDAGSAMITLRIPIRPASASDQATVHADQRPAPGAPPSSGHGKAGDDVRSADERSHGQPGTL